MKEILTKHCLICDKVFEKKPSKSMAIWLKECKYCSWSCYSESRKTYCNVCGKLCPHRTKGRYHASCSKECKRIHHSRCQKASKRLLTEEQLIRLRKINYEQQFRKEPTRIEIAVYKVLTDMGIIYEKQKFINDRFCVDAYIPSMNLVIEADGDYWHSLDKTVKKDRAENAYLTACGYSILRIPESKIKDGEHIEILNDVIKTNLRYR